MSSEFLNVRLYVHAEPIHQLLIWLDFHKRAFNAGVIILSENSDKPGMSPQTKHILNTVLPKFGLDWKIVCESVTDTRNGLPPHNWTIEPKCTVNLTPNDFLFFRKNPSGETYIRPLSVPVYVAELKNETAVANNIVDFLSNVANTWRANSRENPPTEIALEYIAILSWVNPGAFRNDYVPSAEMMRFVQDTITEIKTTDYVYYLDAFPNAEWGDVRVLLLEDINLLQNTDFNDTGHRILPMQPYTDFLRAFVERKLTEITGCRIDAAKYHTHISDEDHKRVLNAMPYNKYETPEMREFCEYMETRVSEIVGTRVKLFNDDVWVRICRPTAINPCDFNPCHRDVYLDFYRNIVNIYVPIVGSNELSSLAMESGSHLWKESETMMTKGGAYFETTGKKYSVDAVVQCKRRLQMSRPNPQTNEFILFSPYLIHGCSNNDNIDITRMSVEMRFIQDTEQSRQQEETFRQFVQRRLWR
jgi:ectoine hydroxylase-related dioxygenase (phytanoyl-CoA dioxygenase family)